MQVCLVEDSRYLAILSVDRLVSGDSSSSRFLNKFDFFDLESLKKQIAETSEVREQEEMAPESDRQVYNSDQKRDQALFFEGPFQVRFFSVSKKRQMIMLRSDHKLGVCPSLSSQDCTLIDLQLQAPSSAPCPPR